MSNWENLFQHSPGFVASLGGPNFVYDYANVMLAQILGRDPSGKRLGEVAPNLNATGVIEKCRQVYQSGVAEQQPEMPLLVGGKQRYFNVTYVPRKDLSDKVDGALIWGLDVTELVMARKKLEESEAKLQKSQEQLVAAAAVAKIGFFDWDIGTNQVNFSYQMRLDWGIMMETPFEEAISRIHIEDREKTLQLIRHSIERGVEFHCHYRVIRPDQSVIWIEAQGSVFRNSKGAPLRLFGTSVDITDRKETEQALAFGNHQFETIFKNSPSAMAVFRGPQHVYEKVNDVYKTLFPGRELLSKPFLVAMPEMQDSNFAKLIENVYRTGEHVVVRNQLVLTKKPASDELEERYFTASFTQVKDTDGNRYGIFHHTFETTDQVLAQKRMEASDELHRLALLGGQMGTWTVLLPGYRLVFDKKARELHGVEEHEDPRVGVDRQLHPDDREIVRNALFLSMTKGTPYECEYRTRMEGGGFRWVYVRGEPKRNENGEAISVSGITFDISQRKMAAIELENAKEAAERANQTKSAFLANMSHEIRTPLGAILGFTDLLKSPDLREEDRGEFLDTISRNGKALTRIIDDILDLAKVESGKMEIENVEFSFFNLINEVLDLFRERTRAKGISLRIHFLEKVPNKIFSDPSRLRQILINIVGNAVKFTEAGNVTLQVKASPISDDRWRFTLTVKDTGVGLTSEQRSRLFQPFVQADNTTGRKFGGTGLGLVLSKRLAIALGGDIEIETNPEESGSTFVIRFSAMAPKSVTPPIAEIADLPSDKQKSLTLSGVQILLAEDSLDNQVLVKHILKKNGANVKTANDGLEAFRLGMGEPFDIVLMDIQMPGMDGYEATRSLRKAGFKRPIIALTAHAMAEEKALTMAAGCNGHLTKPINQEELIHTIQDFIQHRRE